MTLQKHNQEGFSLPDKDADIIPFKGRGEAIEARQDPVRFFIQQWISSEVSDQTLAETIVADTDIVGNTDDEMLARLKAALRASPLYDNFDEICAADSITDSLQARVRAATDGMSPARKALLALMDVRAIEIIKFPDQDISAQLAKLPLGDEDKWEELLGRI